MSDVKRRIILLLLCGWLIGIGRANPSLDHARQAAAMLGRETWSQVIKIKNERWSSGYPRTVFGLVFEFGGVLWFYNDLEGTRSLSRHLGETEQDKIDCRALVLAIDAGFVAAESLPESMEGAVVRRDRPDERLPYGCFIESVVALRERVVGGEGLTAARLLTFYGETAQGPFGHTVLTYETVAGAFVFDAQEWRTPRRIGDHLPKDPKPIAHLVRPDATLSLARWVPTPQPKAPVLVAAGEAWGARVHYGALLSP